jgi:hypothetical protein
MNRESINRVTTPRHGGCTTRLWRVSSLMVMTLPVGVVAQATNSPPPRSASALVRDARDGSLLLYGGHAVQGAPPDARAVIWRWSGGTWQSVAPLGDQTPGVRADMVMVFDSAAGRLLLVGGQTRDSAYGDVWSWQGGTWTRLADDGPGGRHLAGGAFDPLRHEVLLVGGHDLNANVMRHDTWAYGPRGWRLADSTPTLGQRFAMGMAWDPTRRAIVMHGGHTVDGGMQSDTWQWSGRSWQRIAVHGPSLQAHQALVTDPLGRGVLLVSAPGDQVRGPMETWLFEGANWRRLTTGGPSPRGDHAVVHDPVGRRVLLFGGARDSRTKFNDVWQFDGESWTQLTP